MTYTKYILSIPKFHIRQIRAAHRDTLFGSTALVVSNANGSLHLDYGAQHVDLGKHAAGGDVDITLLWLADVPDPTPDNPDGGAISWTFLLANAGHTASADGFVAVLNKAVDSFAGKLADGVFEGGSITLLSLGGLAGLLGLQELVNLVTTDCDGMVACGNFHLTAAQLAQMAPPPGGFWAQSQDNPGTNSPAGCGANSDYLVTYTISRPVIYLAWKGSSDDQRLFYSSSPDGLSPATWAGQVEVSGHTSDSPALAAFNGNIYLAWKGEGADSRMFFSSSSNGNNWSGQALIGGNTSVGLTSNGPALAAFNGDLYLVWKGEGADTRMFYSKSSDGKNWTSQAQVGGNTSDRPAVAAFNGNIYLAWKGEGTDSRMFFSSSSNGNNWSGQALIGGNTSVGLTSNGPALAAFNGYLYLVWKGEGTDTRMFYSKTSDGKNWTGQALVGGNTSIGNTSDRPTLAAFNENLFLAWKGEGADPRIFLAATDNGETWSLRGSVGGDTSNGPALAAPNLL
jgi:hypothetical protein